MITDLTSAQRNRYIAAARAAGKYVTPPEDGGQIVQSSYACDGDSIYVLTTDRSDRTCMLHVYGLPRRKDKVFEPWNSRPAMGYHEASFALDGPLF